jgi:tetratricopeptide (TPR) repeat protein
VAAEEWVVDVIHSHLDGYMVGVAFYEVAREMLDIPEDSFAFSRRHGAALDTILGNYHMGVLHHYFCSELGDVVILAGSHDMETEIETETETCNALAMTYFSRSMELMEALIEEVGKGAHERQDEFEQIQSHFDYGGMLNDLCLLVVSAGGDPSHARALYNVAVGRFPDSVVLLANFASFLFAQGDIEAAAKIETMAIAVAQEGFVKTTLLHNRGIHLFELGNTGAAMEVWEQTVAQRDFDGSAFFTRLDLASARCTHGQWLEARDAYREAVSDTLAGAGGQRDAIMSGAIFGAYSGILPHVITSVEQAQQDRLHFVENLKILIRAAQTPAGLDQAIEAMDLPSGRGRGRLPRTHPLQLVDPGKTVGCSSLGYYLIYDGGDNLEPRRLLAQFYRHATPSLDYIAPWLLPEPPLTHSGSTLQQPRLRVGFLSSVWYHHSVGLLLESVIAGLPRDRFDVHLIALDSVAGISADQCYVPAGSQGDAVSRRLSLALDRENIHPFAKHVPLASLLSAIENLKLDVLVFGEVGMHAKTYFTAFSRIARRTVAFWGHATTTGISPMLATTSAGMDSCSTGGIDYFVSSALVEPPGAQHKYSERLALMPGLSFGFRYPVMPTGLPIMPLDVIESGGSAGALQSTRRTWLISVASAGGEMESALSSHEALHGPDWHLYSVPQTLYKLHPDFDRIIAGVLAADPKGLVVALRGHHEQGWFDRFMARIEAAMPAGAGAVKRVVSLPALRREDYLRFVGLSDIILDTFPVGGGRSSLEIFATGTPIVVLYPRTSILQLTSGMYAAMGMFVPPDVPNSNNSCSRASVDEGLVTFSEAHYIQAAVEVASNVTRQASLRSKILSRNGLLFTGDDRGKETAAKALAGCPCCKPNTVIEDWTRLLEGVSAYERPHCAAIKSGAQLPFGRAWDV